MTRAYRPICVAAMLCALVTAALADVTIPGVPFYPWYRGCGPTAGGMIVGYWDSSGFGNLIPGSNDWSTNQAAIETMIASPDHIVDYWGADRVPPPPLHADDCVADFMHASRGPYADGYSPFSMQDNGLAGYAEYCGYLGSTALNTTYDENDSWADDTYWNAFLAEINAGRPVELYTDSDADGNPDHFVTAYGYDAQAKQYICHNPSSPGEKRYDFARAAPGQAFGLRGSTSFIPVPEPATLALLALGGLPLLARAGGRRRKRNA
jgi:hypothetical protein